MRTIIGLCMLCLLAMPVVAQESLEDIEKAITAKWDAVNSLSAAYDLTASFRLSPEQSVPMSLVGGGTVDYSKAGGTPRHKGYLWAGFTADMPLLRAQAVHDGSEGHYEARAPLFGLNSSGKMKAGEIIQPGGKSLFDAARENMVNLTVLPEEQVGGEDCYVLKADSKDADSFMAGIKAWVSKSTGVVKKVVLFDVAGGETAVLTMKDVKLNGEIGLDTFKFVSLAAQPAKQ